MKKKQTLVFEALESRHLMAGDLTSLVAPIPDAASEKPFIQSLFAEGEDPIAPASYAAVTSSAQIVFVDGLGQAVSELVSGREYWLELRTKDTREKADGVFAAYVDIGFSSESMQIVSAPVGIGFYVNGRQGVEVGPDFLKSFGGFSNSIKPTGPEASIAAVRVKVGSPGPLALDVTLAKDRLKEFLLYGVNHEIDPANVSISIPQFTIVSEADSTTPNVPLGDATTPPVPITVPEPKEIVLKFQIDFLDSDGQSVTVLRTDQEYSMQLTAIDLRPNPIGVFSAYVDIDFDPGAIEVIDKPEGSSDFFIPKYEFQSTPGKIEGFGGTNRNIFFPYTPESKVATVRIRAEEAVKLDFHATPAIEGMGIGIYGYGEIDTSQVTIDVPSIEIIDSHDTNGDGLVSPIDALIMIDYLTRQHSSKDGELFQLKSQSSLDVSNDGVVSALDVLLVIEYLQLKIGLAHSSTASGEGESDSSYSTADLTKSTSAPDSLIEMLAADQISQELTLKRARRT